MNWTGKGVGQDWDVGVDLQKVDMGSGLTSGQMVGLVGGWMVGWMLGWIGGYLVGHWAGSMVYWMAHRSE